MTSRSKQQNVNQYIKNENWILTFKIRDTTTIEKWT